MIIAQVYLRLDTIKDHSKMCSFTVLGGSENQSVSGVTTIFLTQCNTSPSHRVDQGVDCGLWHVGHSSSKMGAKKKCCVYNFVLYIYIYMYIYIYIYMSRILHPKVTGSSLGPAGIVGGGSECTALSPSSIQYNKARPLSKAPNPQLLPGRTAPGVCVCVCSRCVCSLLCVCT